MPRRVPQKPVDNAYFQLSSNGGVPRWMVLEVLGNPKLVRRAVESGRCFQCQATDIDPTGLCLICRSFLSDEERQAAQRYYNEPAV